MAWIIFSLLAAFSWAVVNIINKFVISKWTYNFHLLLAIFSILSLLASIFVFAFIEFTFISPLNTLLALIAGAFYYLTVYFYYKALSVEEVSRVMPLYSLTPVFVALFAGIFLGEILTITNYTGIFLIVLGAVSISTKKLSKIRIGQAFWFMVIATLSSAAIHVLTKYLLGFADYWTVFSYVRLGTFLAGAPILIFGRNHILQHINKYGKRLVGLVSFNNVLNLIGVLFLTIASASEFVSLANAVASTQPFFVLLIALILSIFYPRILKEEIGKGILVRKLFSIAIMLIGVIMVT